MALHMYHSLFLSLRPTRRRKLYHTYTYTQTGAYLEMIISTSIFTSDAAQHGTDGVRLTTELDCE
jgi:hypothetical protein